MPDTSTTLAEIRRVLKPGEHFYASTVGVNNLRELAALFLKHRPDVGRGFSFNLENGRDRLAPHFTHVTLHRYDDALVVTEAEPLIVYLLSLSSCTLTANDEARAELIKRVQDIIAQHGAIRLTEDVGLFEAW